MKPKMYMPILFAAILLLMNGKANAQGVGNHLTMSLENCTQTSSNTMEFDLMIMSDGDSSSDLRVNCVAYGINFNTAILANSSDSVHASYVAGTSEISPPLGGFSFPSSVFQNHVRIIESVWTGGNIWGQGVVNVSGTAVTLVSGDHFICNGCGRSGFTTNIWSNTPTAIVINGVTDTISSVSDSIHLILKYPAGTQAGVSYSVNSPNIVNPMIVGHNYRVGRFKITCASGWATGTSPNFSLQSTVAGGRTNCVALAYEDTATNTLGFSATGTGNGQRIVGVGCTLILNSCAATAPTITNTGGDTLTCSPANYRAYQWFLNGTPIVGDTFPTSVAYQTGSYKIYVVDTNGCHSFSNSINITVCGLSLTVPSITNATCGTCANGSAYANVQNGTPPYTITWYTSPMHNGTSASALLPGTYTVCARDANNCTTCSSFTIDSINCTGYSISASDSNATCITCSDGRASVTATGGTPPYHYLWSNGTTTSSANTFSHGTYTVSVTDAIGCLQTTTVTVGVGYCKANYNLYADTIPHTYTIVNTAIGAPPISYLWSWGDGSTDTAAYPMHTYATAGFYTICLNITDNVGCTSAYCDSFTLLSPSSSAMISVTVIAPLANGIGNADNFYQTLKLFPNPTNGSVAISYSLPKSSDVAIGVYNSYGQLVNEIINGRQPAGRQETVFDAQKLAAGIYFVKVIVDGNATVLKLAKM